MTGRKYLQIGVSLGIIITSIFMFCYGYNNTWKVWNIPTVSIPFADLRTITGAVESRDRGYDPLIENPGDPWNRKMNYPRIWETFSIMGLNNKNIIYFGLLIIILFITGIFLFIPKTISKTTAKVLLISFFSPAVLLGIERGNIDLLMFFLLSLAIFFVCRENSISKIISIMSVLLAFTLKLFPIFAVGLFLRNKKTTVIKLGIITLIFITLYLMFFYHDLSLIREGTPKGNSLSYGIEVISLRTSAENILAGKIVKNLSYIIATMTLMVALFVSFKTKLIKIDSDDSSNNEKNITTFRTGSGVYVGTFLLGSNFDYRLVFLLFVIPQLMLWSKSPFKYLRIISKSIIIGIVISLWYLVISRFMSLFPFGEYIAYFLDEFANWMIFGGLLFLFLHSLPAWINDDIINFYSKIRQTKLNYKR